MGAEVLTLREKLEQSTQRLGKRGRCSTSLTSVLPLKKRLRTSHLDNKLPLRELESSIYRQIGLIQHKKAQISLTASSHSCALCKRRFKNEQVKLLCTVAQEEHVRRLSGPVLLSAAIYRQRRKVSGSCGNAQKSAKLRLRNLKQGRINNLRIQRARCLRFKSCGMCFVPFSFAELSRMLSRLDRRINTYETQLRVPR